MKKFIWIGLALFAIAAFVGYKMYNKPHANMANAKADVTATATELFTAFDADEEKANQQYLGKVVAVKGRVEDIQKADEGGVKSLSLETGDPMAVVSVVLDELHTGHRKDFAVGEEVKFNCICAGKLIDIELTRCVELK